jgi:hypothetical protein
MAKITKIAIITLIAAFGGFFSCRQEQANVVPTSKPIVNNVYYETVDNNGNFVAKIALGLSGNVSTPASLNLKGHSLVDNGLGNDEAIDGIYTSTEVFQTTKRVDAETISEVYSREGAPRLSIRNGKKVLPESPNKFSVECNVSLIRPGEKCGSETCPKESTIFGSETKFCVCVTDCKITIEF